MELFNNREIALLVWSTCLISYSLLKTDFNSSVKPVINSFFSRQIMILVSIVFLYVCTSVAALSQLGLWDVTQFKNTLVWTFFVSLPAIFKISREDSPPRFTEVLKSNLGLLVIVEFLVNSYSFNLLVELLLIPFSTALLIFVTFSKEVNSKRLSENLMGAIGALLILWTTFQLYKNYSSFMSISTLQAFSTPALLSISYFPFLFLLSFFFRYEKFNIGLQLAIKDKELRSFIRPRAILKLHLNMTSLERWKNSLYSMNINSKESALESVERIKNILKKERENRYVALHSGWRPQEAKDFLIEKELPTGHYKTHDDKNWYASSPYYEVGTGLFPNNIAYYVDGSSEIATNLRIVMNINSKEMLDESFAKYVEIVGALVWHALKEPLPPPIKRAIYEGKNMVVQLKRSEIRLLMEELPDHFNQGCRVELSITPHTKNSE
jgi:hypothetical protein